MANLVIGFILYTIGIIILRMAHQPAINRPLMFNSVVLASIIPTILIIGGLYLCFTVQWYFAIIVFFTAPLVAEIIRKSIWR